MSADLTTDPGAVLAEELEADEAAPAYGTPPTDPSPDAGDPELPAPAVEPAAGELVPVDPPAPAAGMFSTVLADAVADRKPVLPRWASDWRTFAATVRRAVSYGRHWSCWHLIRLPYHLALLLCWFVPRGLYRGTGALRRWLADTETAALQREAVRHASSASPATVHEATRDHMALTKQRRNRSGWRWLLVVVVAVAAVVVVALAAAVVPGWPASCWPFGVAAVLAVARLGRNPDETLFGHAVVRAESPKLSSVVVVAALQMLGIAALTPTKQRTAQVAFVAEIARDGKGYRADMDLPAGVTALEVIAERAKLAGNLRRPMGCVWPETVPTAHPGRLSLYVADRDPATLGPVKWALADRGAASFFAPFHFGDSARGMPVTLSLFEHNILIGSQPGQGKTAAVRVILAAASLDPLVDVWLHELKGSGDLDAWEPVSYRFVSGITDDAMAYTAHSLRLLRAEVMRRADALKAVPAAFRPDNKVTPEIAGAAKYKLRPLVAIIDECQNLFAHKEHGKAAAEDAEFVIKIGRAFGVVLVLATQRPDKNSLPTGIADNVSIRFCLCVSGQVANDMVLGTSSYQEGLRASDFRPRTDAGTGWLKGAHSEPVVVRAAYLDGPASAKVAERALVLRRAAGVITGHAAGIAPEEPEDPSRIVVDVLRVWTPGEDAVWSETLATRLAELDPGRYGELADAKRGAAILGARLRALGVGIKDRHRKVAGRGLTRKGPSLADLEAHLVNQGRPAVPALDMAPEGGDDTQ